MNNLRIVNRNLVAMAWGILFIWWGVTELVTFLPQGTGIFGIGLILLGLNVARILNAIPTSSCTITLGTIALVWGGLEMAGAILGLPIELPIFAISLIVLGLILLVREMLGMTGTIHKTGLGNVR